MGRILRAIINEMHAILLSARGTKQALIPSNVPIRSTQGLIYAHYAESRLRQSSDPAPRCVHSVNWDFVLAKTFHHLQDTGFVGR